MDKLFDIKKKISDQEYISLCSITNDIISLLIIKYDYDDYESDDEIITWWYLAIAFSSQLATEYPDFDIGYSDSNMDELFDTFINCPDNGIRRQQGKLEH